MYSLNWAKGPATIILERGDVVSADARRKPVLITCLAGRLWLTGTRDGADLILQPGSSLRVVDGGRLVLQALRAATVRLEGISARPTATAVPVRPVPQTAF
jgi:hypothetical protein